NRGAKDVGNVGALGLESQRNMNAVVPHHDRRNEAERDDVSPEAGVQNIGQRRPNRGFGQHGVDSRLYEHASSPAGMYRSRVRRSPSSSETNPISAWQGTRLASTRSRIGQ